MSGPCNFVIFDSHPSFEAASSNLAVFCGREPNKAIVKYVKSEGVERSRHNVEPNVEFKACVERDPRGQFVR
jgi:hypothetical protein